jgi:nicotinamidase/pyrazinamidase
MADNVAFLDIDTQRDFVFPNGALYVPGAEGIIEPVEGLMKLAKEAGIPVLSTADAHPRNDPSFREWPPHCVIGTWGQLRIPATSFPRARIIPNRPFDLDPPRYLTGQTIFEKTSYDATSNPNFCAVLRALEFSRLIAFGVATDYCVRATVLSILKMGVGLDVVLDAIKGIHPETSRTALDQMKANGAKLVHTADVIRTFSIPGQTTAR